MCVNINKACNGLCSQSLCEVVVNSCRELELKSSFVLRVSSCYFGICCCHYSVKKSYKRKKDKTDFCDLLFLLFCIFVYL